MGTKEIATALVAAQKAIKPAIKDAKNAAFKRPGESDGSRYADLASVWDACREALTENGIAVVQVPNFDGNDVWLETTLLHTSGETITGRYPLRPTKNDPQGYGSALTYARRYSLAAMIGVVADDDDDGNSASVKHDAPVEHAPAKPALTPAERAAKAKAWGEDAIGFVNRTGASETFKAWREKNLQNVANLREIHPDLHKRLLAAIEGRESAFASARAA